MKTRIILTLSIVLGACNGIDELPPDPPSATLEVIGSYSNNFGGTETITATNWGTTTIVEFDNARNFVITQNPTDDMFNPSKFNRIVWTEAAKDEPFFYCFVDFGLDTASAAKTSTRTADATDPSTGGCGGFAWTELYHPIEIEGTYHSTFGGVESFSHRTFPYGAKVITFDNDSNFAITQSPADDMFNPNKFGKVVWTEPVDGRFFYCFVTFGEDTEADARNTTETADDNAPRESGCGGFPWTEVEPLLEIEGTYDNNFGSEETITSDLWGTATVRGYDNDENVVYLQLPEDDMFNPNKFNKVVYTEPMNDSLYYCWVDFGLDSIEDAKTSTATWDASDPDNSGCGGFSWTKLTRR